MFFILSKTLYFLLMPVTWIVLAFLLCTFVKKYRKQFFIAGLFFLLLFTNAFITNELLLWWEIPPVAVAPLPAYKVGVVLGGITTDREPRDRVHITRSADRILQAVHLYQEGKINKILISGGSGKLLKDEIPEAVLLGRILALCKVPERDILLEPHSRNTHENAVNSALLLKNKFPDAQYLLITSAYHMRRAKACFRKENLPMDVFSVDQKSNERKFTPDMLFIPSAEALAQWETVIRELTGMVIYKVAGYV